MKRFYSFLLLTMLVASSAFAANITSAGDGNWNSTTPNAPWPGGVVPSPGDDVFIRPGDDITVTANATINSITFLNTSATTRTLTVNSGFVLTVTTSITLQNAATGNTLATIAGAGKITCASLNVGGTIIAPNLTGDGSPALTSTVAFLNISGNLSLIGVDDGNDDSNPTFNLQSGIDSVSGSVVLNEPSGAAVNFTLASGAQSGTLAVGGSTAFNITGAPTFDLSGTTTTVNYMGGNQTVEATTYTNLLVSGSGTKTLNGNTSASDITINSGVTLSVPSGNTLTATNGSGFDITVDGTLENAGTVTLSSATMQVNSGGTYDHAEDAGTIPTATWNDGSTCLVSGNSSDNPPSGVGQSFYDFTWNSPGEAAGDDPSFAGGFSSTSSSQVRGTLRITSTGGGTLRLLNSGATRTLTVGNFIQTGGTFYILGLATSGTSSMTLTVTGNFELSGGTLQLSAATGGTASGILNVGGNFTHTAGTLTESATTGTSDIFFNGSGTQTYTSGGTVSNSVNFTVNSGATLQMAAAGTVVSGNAFTLSSGATLGITSTSGINSSGASGNIQTTTRTFSSGANLIYNGSSAQNSGVFTTTPTAHTINNLTVNGGGVSLQQRFNIVGSVTFTSGNITSSAANPLVFNDGATVNGSASHTSNVDGVVYKGGNDAFTFPVGDPAASYHYLSISAPGALTDTFTCEYFRASAYSLGNIDPASGIQAISQCEYWDLTRKNGTSNVDVTISWNVKSKCGGGGSYVNDPPIGLTVGWLDVTPNPDLWKIAFGGGATNITRITADSGTVKKSGVTSYGKFVLASTTVGGSPLPVKFADFKAYQKQAGVQLDWNTYSELNVSHFEVERSTDGINFSKVGQVTATNLSNGSSYGWFDASPARGNNFYRIRTVDIDSKAELSSIVRINLDKSSGGVVLYPNPVKGDHISFRASDMQQGVYNISIFDNAGRKVYGQSFSHSGGAISQSIQLPSSMRPGMYTLQIASGDSKTSKPFIVQ